MPNYANYLVGRSSPVSLSRAERNALAARRQREAIRSARAERGLAEREMSLAEEKAEVLNKLRRLKGRSLVEERQREARQREYRREHPLAITSPEDYLTMQKALKQQAGAQREKARAGLYGAQIRGEQAQTWTDLMQHKLFATKGAMDIIEKGGTPEMATEALRAAGVDPNEVSFQYAGDEVEVDLEGLGTFSGPSSQVDKAMRFVYENPETITTDEGQRELGIRAASLGVSWSREGPEEQEVTHILPDQTKLTAPSQTAMDKFLRYRQDNPDASPQEILGKATDFGVSVTWPEEEEPVSESEYDKQLSLTANRLVREKEGEAKQSNAYNWAMNIADIRGRENITPQNAVNTAVMAQQELVNTINEEEAWGSDANPMEAAPVIDKWMREGIPRSGPNSIESMLKDKGWSKRDIILAITAKEPLKERARKENTSVEEAFNNEIKDLAEERGVSEDEVINDLYGEL